MRLFRLSAELMAQHGTFLVPTLVTYQQLLEGGAAAGMAPELVAKVGALVQQVCLHACTSASDGVSGMWLHWCCCGLCRVGVASVLKPGIPLHAAWHVQGLESLALARRHGITMCFGSDLLGDLHPAQLDEFTLRSQVLSAKVSGPTACCS